MASRIGLLLLVLGALFFSSCRSTYQKVEEHQVRTDSRVFWHKHPDGVSISLVCRRVEKNASWVAFRIKNEMAINMKVSGKPQLYVDGKPIEMKGKEAEAIDRVLKPGEAFTHDFSYSFNAYDPKLNKVVPEKQGEKLVYAQVGPHITPTVIVDLAADNMVPFRFASFD